MVNVHFLPMLIAGILCALLAIITWLYRRHESINRIFSLFTLILSADSFVFFFWYHFGSVENAKFWGHFTTAAGFLVPIGLIFFFYAFTGFDKRLDEKIYRIRAGNFRIVAVIVMILCIFLAQFTNLIQKFSNNSENVWDSESGALGIFMLPLFAVIFTYLFTVAVRAYKTTENLPQKRFILLLTIGTAIWLVTGYIGAAILPTRSLIWQALIYSGTTLMAIFYFVAILNYQSDKVSELNKNLENKVVERTRHLKETQMQLVQSEKMASLGRLVAGVAHEMNSPVGAVYSVQGTLSAAVDKLKNTIETEYEIDTSSSPKLSRIFRSLNGVNEVIHSSSERITGIVGRLKSFARLDEADLQVIDFNEAIQNTIEVFQYHLKPDIKINTTLSDLPLITCFPAEINQLCLQLLTNANHAIEESGEIQLTTRLKDEIVYFSVRDSGKGIDEEILGNIFDPGFTAWNLKVGTGLGLAICYQIAEKHKGKITVDSEPGTGSTFTFSFPVKGLEG
ncbi:hypothetical protein K8I28_00655 [bacterium]|nr:hypothetical protein [bacterium]